MPYSPRPCLCTHARLYPDGGYYCDLVSICGKMADRAKNSDCKLIIPGMPKLKTLAQIMEENRGEYIPKRTKKK